MRVEDLTTGAAPLEEQAQLADLAAVGVDHDGPVERQSDRRALHDRAVERLVAEGWTYPCWCSRREAREAAAAPHGPGPGRYPGTCRDLDATARRERERSAGRPPALRLRAGGQEVTAVDELVGEVSAHVDDVVLRRADGVPAYNVAVVVDDAEQGVDQVVRADDLLHVTPAQVLLQRLLDLPTPRYLHVPLVLGPDGERLAKRHGAVTLGDRLALGETAEDVVGRLGWSAGLLERPRPATAAELASAFDPARLRREPWVMDR